MSFYVVAVQPRKEPSFLTLARQGATDVKFYWPRRHLTIRRKGKKVESLAPVFSGYVFIEAEEITPAVFRAIKSIPGFYRFLERNDRIRPLSGSDLELVGHFIKFGEIIGKSQVIFNAESRIEVKSGPLTGLEGKIIKVDKRKQRAKVQLDLYKESFLVDFGFELLSPTNPSQAN